MCFRLIRASALVLALSACIPRPVAPPPRPPTPKETLAGKCLSLDRDGRLVGLPDEEQRWVRDCAAAFVGPGDLDTAKARVRLALEFREDHGLWRDASPVEWADFEPAVVSDLVALEKRPLDGEALALLARWRGEVMNERGPALLLACKSAQLAPSLFEAHLACGDYVLSVRDDVFEALNHWKLAYPLAKRRWQQCQVVGRVLEHSLRPEDDLEGMSRTVVERCLRHERERVHRDEAEELREVARDLREASRRLRQAAREAVGEGAPPQQQGVAQGQK